MIPYRGHVAQWIGMAIAVLGVTLAVVAVAATPAHAVSRPDRHRSVLPEPGRAATSVL
jgi:hypothetical protein